MRKKLKKQKSSTNNSASKEVMDDGFSSLVDGYTLALEDNSFMITAMLEELSKRELSKEDKKALDSIGKGLEKIDRNINKLGK